MKQRWLNMLPMVAVLALAASACDSPPAGTSSSRSLVAPHASASASGVVLLAGTGNTVTRSFVIDEEGAKINIGPNSLVVPRGAVSGPTQFTFMLQAEPTIAARLTAVDVQTGKLVTTFKSKLTLTLSYANSTTPVADPTTLRVYWVDNGVVLDAQPSGVNVKGQKVTALLSHFSEYSPGLEPVDNTDAAPLP